MHNLVLVRLPRGDVAGGQRLHRSQFAAGCREKSDYRGVAEGQIFGGGSEGLLVIIG